MADGAPAMSVRTTCPYCGVGCGVLATRRANGAVGIEGDPDHPANFGRLCSKGSALGETVGLQSRLLYPQLRGRRASWEQATSLIAEKFRDIIDRHGPDAVAFYVSGQILIEDYYVANKLMKGFIGSANIDTNSRLCMASSVAGHKRAFGADVVPGCYEDLELADVIVLVGSNLAWCHPVLWRRIEAARQQRPEMKVVVIDPRGTATSEGADLHLPIRPGGDVALFSGLLHYLEKSGARNAAFVEQHTVGVAEALGASLNLETAARLSGLAPEKLSAFYELFRITEKAVTVFSQGVNQATNGTDRVNSIINCHLLTGRIGRPGMGPFSVTGQPNAMGGREVGGLANQLASHMELDNPGDRARVQTFWRSPKIAERPGCKAVDLFEAIHEGSIKALWIMGTNPAVSMPDANRVRAALKQCELVVISEIEAHTDTVQYAHVLLPSTAWGEKNGMVTNSERRMSRQRAFLPPPGEARDDWRQFCEVAQAMGWGDAFAYEGPEDIFREYAALCSYDNNSARALDLAGLESIKTDAYYNFLPVQWPVASDSREGERRLFGDGRFFTPDKRARFVVLDAGVAARFDPDYPYILNSGRIRDQWHTMTRSGRAPRLARHIAEPFVEISPADAVRENLQTADLARIVSPRGEMIARVVVTNRQQEASLFVPMHWNDAYAASACVDALIAADVDPHSGQPALKSSTVRIASAGFGWHGFSLIKTEGFTDWRAPNVARYWAKAVLENGVRAEMAGDDCAKDIHHGLAEDIFAPLLTAYGEKVEISSFCDQASETFHYAAFIDGAFCGGLYVSAAPACSARSFLCDALGKPAERALRASLLAGRTGAGAKDRGLIICSCMNVGAKEIAASVASGCRTVDAVGAATGAGANCGSCRAEIAHFLPEAAYAKA